MAKECTLIYETGIPLPMTCADGAGIEKGAVLLLSDPSTVATTTGDTDPCGGIAAIEKISGNGQTKISVHTEGVFRGYAGAAGVVAGDGIITDTATGAANELVKADLNSGHLVGTALETATDGQTFLFVLKPTNLKLA